MKEYTDIEPFNINRSTLNDNLEVNKNSNISFLRIKDLILKCYPQFGFHMKKGLSVKKLMMRYDLNSLQMSEEKKGSVLSNMILNNLSQGLSKPKKSKTKSKKKNLLNCVVEKEEDNTKTTSKLEDNM